VLIMSSDKWTSNSVMYTANGTLSMATSDFDTPTGMPIHTVNTTLSRCMYMKMMYICIYREDVSIYGGCIYGEKRECAYIRSLYLYTKDVCIYGVCIYIEDV
jgi:hypothetical protein